jgi:hypothetical protein
MALVIMKMRPILLEAINIIYINTIIYKCHNAGRTALAGSNI